MSRLSLCQPFGVSYLLLFSSPFVFNPVCGVCVSRSLPLNMFLLNVLVHFAVEDALLYAVCVCVCVCVCAVCADQRAECCRMIKQCFSFCIQILRGTEQTWTLWCSPQVSTPSVRKVSHSLFAEMSQRGGPSHPSDQDDIITVQRCCCSGNHQREFESWLGLFLNTFTCGSVWV